MKQETDKDLKHLTQLLEDLEQISLDDIAKFPEDKQHLMAETIENLQDQLKEVVNDSKLLH
ncbi:hypothetical protein [Marinomonas sp. TW1]|uniref:hypothetical protein n=1 Tax=Marinomonas sp. TW1 TaxID=1561203 RepID=UPI0007AF6EEC|nr:hypothetical protein [Marinomonas sp. TW1]KZN13873.1 hypothetical protein OA79_09155 [Marinomonas sp. TW1]